MIVDSSPNLSDAHLESYIGRADRSTPSIQTTALDGKPCWMISYVDKKACSVRAWIDAQRGPSVVRMEVEWTARGKHFVDAIQSDLKEWPPSRVWFPSRCTYSRKVDHKEAEREVVDVDVISLNMGVDPRVFTLLGMEVRPETPLTGYRDPRGSVVWNGAEIAPERAQLAALPRTPSHRLFLLVNAAAFAILAALLVWRYLRRA
jgi:hypothetical protein